MRLDVSEVLTSPEFLDTFMLTRQTNLHVGGGRFTNHKETQPARGVITQVDGLNVQVTENGKIIHGSIRIHTSERLTVGFSIRDNDIVIYSGRKYIVKSISDYSRYGLGFVEAYCELIKNEECKYK